MYVNKSKIKAAIEGLAVLAEECVIVGLGDCVFNSKIEVSFVRVLNLSFGQLQKVLSVVFVDEVVLFFVAIQSQFDNFRPSTKIRGYLSSRDSHPQPG